MIWSLSKYGEARTVEIPVVKRAVADFAVGADWTPVAGDVKISKDGAAAANVTNLPTALVMGNGAVWSFALTATEMQAARVLVTVVDAATKAVEDQSFIIETYGHASAQHAFDLDTNSVAQTGDNFARLGAPAGASVSVDVAAVKTDTGAIKTKTDSLTFTGALRVDANIAAINNATGGVSALDRSLRGLIEGTVGAGATTTSIPTSSLAPAVTVADQLKGRIVVFDENTATAALRGQATDITTNTAAGVLTVTALTTAPASGDTFTVV